MPAGLGNAAGVLTDEDLVGRYLAGQSPALEELLRRHAHSAYRVALRQLGQDADALDAVQEGFAKVCRALRGYQQRGAFKTWLLRVVENAAHDVRRRRNRRCLVTEGSSWLRLHDDLLPAVESNPANGLVQAELRGVMNKALGLLPLAQRRVFTLHAVDGLTYREVAEELRVPVGTVMSRLHHARRKLRASLADQFISS